MYMYLRSRPVKMLLTIYVWVVNDFYDVTIKKMCTKYKCEIKCTYFLETYMAGSMQIQAHSIFKMCNLLLINFLA